MPLERKGVDVVQVASYLRLILTANDEWVVPATADERRYAVFEVPDVRRGDRAYWDALYAQIKVGGLAGFHAFLRAWRIPPGVSLRSPPQTGGLAGQKLAGLRNVESWWYDVLTTGELPVVLVADFSNGDAQPACWEESPQAVEREALRQSYAEWHSSQRYRGEGVSAERFGRELKRLCPSIQSTQTRGDGKRVRKYRLPLLADCRADFVAVMGIAPEDARWDDE